MNWLTLIWSVLLGGCLTLGLMHIVVWCNAGRRAAAHLAFTVAALSVAGIAVGELGLMAARDPAEFARIHRWLHVPVATLVAGIIAFIGLYFQTARPWLGWAALGARGAALLVNFWLPLSVNYSAIKSLRSETLLGQTISVAAETEMSRWAWLPLVSLLLLIVYVGDAAWRLWRRGGEGGRRRAVVVGGSTVAFIVLASIHTWLVHANAIQSPYLISFFFLPVLLAMALELSHDVISAARLSDELEERQKQMSLAAAAAQLALWTWDVERDRLWVTPEGRKLYGVTADEPITIGRFLGLVHPEDREAVKQAVERALNGSDGFAHDYRVVLPDGRVRWFSAVGKVESGRDGQPARLRGVSIESTQRRMTEVEIAEQRSELAHLSRVSTLGQLSGAIAHELNQPLGIILSNAQAAQRLLEGGTADLGELKAILADIVEEDRRAGEVIKRLRSLLKREDPRRLPLSCNELVRDVIRLTQSELMARGVIVEVVLADGLPEVLGDPVQLQQVLLNLIGNACDAMGSLPAAERVLTVESSGQGSAVRLTIRDRGSGLPEGDAERIFKPFFTTKADGLGMGLAITRSIVEAHGGRVWAVTNEPVGTIFHLELPALPAPP